MTATSRGNATLGFDSSPPGASGSDTAGEGLDGPLFEPLDGHTVDDLDRPAFRTSYLRPALLASLPTWAVLAALAGWVAFSSPFGDAIVPTIALLLAAGVLRLVLELRIARGVTGRAIGLTIAGFAFLVAAGFAGLAGATPISPVILVLPAVVWGIATVAPREWLARLSAAGAVGFTAGIAAFGASRFSELPTTTEGSLVLGTATAAAIVAAMIHGRRVGPSLTHVPDTDAAGAVSAAGHPLEAVRRAIAAQTDPTGIATTAARAINQRFEPSYVAVIEHVPQGNLYLPLAEVINDAGTIDLGRKLAGVTESALSRRTPIWMLDDADDTFTVTCRRLGITGALIVPLEHLSHRVGAIQIAWTLPVGPLALSDALSYATDLGTIITPDLAIAQFATAIERGYFNAISSLAARVDDREDFTRGHSRRVAKHALTIAEALDLENDQQRKLLYAAELHDIGRIGVSEGILSKPGTLSAQEWAEIRSYPRISADIIEPLSFFTDVSEIILHQNERWDGKGYPDRLAGAQIPLLSRILAVADAFDAMTSPRPYRSAMTAQEALTELWKARGTKYDPDVVETLVMSGSVRQRSA